MCCGLESHLKSYVLSKTALNVKDLLPLVRHWNLERAKEALQVLDPGKQRQSLRHCTIGEYGDQLDVRLYGCPFKIRTLQQLYVIVVFHGNPVSRGCLYYTCEGMG